MTYIHEHNHIAQLSRQVDVASSVKASSLPIVWSGRLSPVHTRVHSLRREDGDRVRSHEGYPGHSRV